MPETTPLIKAALNLRVGAGFDVYHPLELCFVDSQSLSCKKSNLAELG